MHFLSMKLKNNMLSKNWIAMLSNIIKKIKNISKISKPGVHFKLVYKIIINQGI